MLNRQQRPRQSNFMTMTVSKSPRYLSIHGQPVYIHPSRIRHKETRTVANPYVHTMHAGSAVIHPSRELVRKAAVIIISTTPSKAVNKVRYQETEPPGIGRRITECAKIGKQRCGGGHQGHQR
ncbi:hypothetical protein BO78DRAFT_24991 [Aspergillus sclerotiicarbonarius CBS 121057]|uniref:Uncharacterized protein n=1 Tax=Aspergillus sclerotiicarbonarius (strain CBS 121057 / IBT 28362) TaxID=1448318 RepID=A0A319EJS6_ASPSB|nr:hypothetical protein BO78DRAFT_24991 [Aspergillus sclerotiicarbonarius CBS 121057]